MNFSHSNTTDAKTSIEATDAMIRRWLIAGYGGLLLMTIIGLAACVDGGQTAYLAVLAVVPAVVVFLPFLLDKRHCPFEPLTLIALLVLTGISIKLWIILGFHDSYHVQHSLLQGKTPEVLTKGFWVCLAGVCALAIGYQLRPYKLPHGWLTLGGRQWNEDRVLIITGVLLAFSIVFFGLFVLSTGANLSNLNELSQKRFMKENVGGSQRIFELSYYYFRFAHFSKFALALGLVSMLRNKRRFTSPQGIVVVLAVLQSVALSVFASNRGGIIMIMGDILLLIYFLRQRATMRAITVTLLGIALLCVSILMLRVQGHRSLSWSDVVEQTIGGRDLMDISKTSHIINAVPKTMEYRYGETLWGWIAAPIPSSVWEGKPMWAARGPFIMRYVYGDRTGKAGMPPGLIAEFYWNFGWTGVIVGMFVFGTFCRSVFATFAPFRTDPTAILIYTYTMNRFVLLALIGDIGSGILKAGLDVVPLALILLTVSKPMSLVATEPTQPTTEPTEGPRRLNRAAI